MLLHKSASLLFLLCLSFSSAFPLSQLISKRGNNTTDLELGYNADTVYYDVPGTNIFLVMTLGGPILDASLLKDFYESVASEAHGFVHRRGHDYQLVEDDKDPWDRSRQQRGYHISFVIGSDPMSPPSITWQDVVHTLDGMYAVLDERPDRLTKVVKIQHKDTGEVYGSASLSLYRIGDGLISNSTFSQPGGIPCRRGCIAGAETS